MEISEQQILAGFEGALQSFPPAFPVSRPPLPGSEEARVMTAGSGRQLSMLLEQSSLLGAFSKILLESPLWSNSEEFCYVWQLWDTGSRFGGYQLMPLGQNTNGGGSSLWQTPLVTDAMPPHSQEDLDKERSWRPPTEGRKGRSRPNNLRDQVAVKAGLRLWRTPNASDVTGGGQDGQKRLDAGHAMQLSDQILNSRLWPTPTERDWKSTSHASKDNSRALSEVAGHSGSGSLSPRFVEELMGFPIDHTALKRSGTPVSRSRPTRSSRRSPGLKGSGPKSGQNGALDERSPLA